MTERRPVEYLRKSLIKNVNEDLDVHHRRIQAKMRERGEADEIIITEPEGHRSAYYSENRPGYQQLRELLYARRISTIYVNDRSRLWRNDVEWLRFLYKCKEYGTDVVAVTEEPIGDISDANQRLMEFMRGNRAQGFRDDLSKRHKDLKRDLKAAGIFAGARAFGVDLVGSKFGRKLVPNQDFAIIIEVLELYTAGNGTPAIEHELEKRGRTWKNGIRRVRADARIILNLIHHLERYEPFLPQDLYERAITRREQRRKGKGNGKRAKHPPLLLRMVLVCDYCGRRLYTRAVANAYFHPANVCATPKRYWNANPLHQQFHAHLAWLDDPLAVEAYLQRLCAPPPRRNLDTKHQRDKLLKQLENLEEAYLAEDYGTLTEARPYYRRKKLELETKLQELPAPAPQVRLEEYVVRGMLENLREALHVTSKTAALEANLVMQQWFAEVRVRGELVHEPVMRAFGSIIEGIVQV